MRITPGSTFICVSMYNISVMCPFIIRRRDERDYPVTGMVEYASMRKVESKRSLETNSLLESSTTAKRPRTNIYDIYNEDAGVVYDVMCI